jgi:hypothetical protein
MTAPNGLSAERLRIGQPVQSVVEHVAPCSRENLARYPIRVYAAEIGTVDYFYSDGRFVVTWKRNPSTPVSYGPEVWPGTVGPAPESTGDTDRPPAPDARTESWDDAIDSYFDGGRPVP